MCPPIDEFPLKPWYTASTVFEWWSITTKDDVVNLFKSINKNWNRPNDAQIAEFIKLVGFDLKPSDPEVSYLSDYMTEIELIKDRPLPEKIAMDFFKKLKTIAKNDTYNRLTSDEIEVISKKMSELNYNQTTINVFREMFLPESNPL